MSCDLTYGRKEACKSNVGGLLAIYIINFDDVDYNLIEFDTNGAITTFGGANPINAYKFELKATTNTFDEVNENSRDNGTSTFTGTLTANLKKLTIEDNPQLNQLSYGRPRIVVEYQTGILRLAGALNGVECAVNSNSGGALGDFSGYQIVGTSNERELAPFLSVDLQTAGLTVVEGADPV